MRGYLGYSIRDTYYGWLQRKNVAREYKYPQGNYGAREWPIGWIAIDGDEVIEHEGVPVIEQEQGEEDEDRGGHRQKKREVREVESALRSVATLFCCVLPPCFLMSSLVLPGPSH